MALTAEQLDRLVDALAAIYDDAELRILEHIARQLAQGLDSPDWAMTKLRELQLLQARLKGNLDALAGKSAEEITKAILDAYNSGRADALADLVRAKLAKDAARGLNPVEDLAMRSLLAETIGATLGMHPRILRSVDDIYRQVVAKAAGVMLTGAQTRRQVAQRALDEFADRGVTGFTDRAGRNWEMRSYAEMALRSASHRASTQGHLDQLQARGHDLVIVSDHSQECSLCLVPGTVVEGPIPTGRTRTEYTGDVIRIVTAAGNDLTGTPDHPVLTPRGWVALKDLRPGDQVVSHDRQQGYPGVMPDHVQVPALIEEVGEAWLPLLTAGPTRRNLNEDVAYREVGGPALNLYLTAELHAALGQPVANHLLVDRVGATDGGLTSSHGDLVGLWTGATLSGGVGRFEHGGSLLRAGVGPALAHGLAGNRGSLLVAEPSVVGDDRMGTRSGLNAGAAQVVADYPAADPEGGAKLLRGLSGHVAFDEVLSVSVRQFAGHVWDLSTAPAWYVANGIVTHNCRPFEGKVLSISGAPRIDGVQVLCTVAEAYRRGYGHRGCRHRFKAYFPGITTVPKGTADPQGDSARQEQRRLERGVRAWKRREAAALDPQAKKAAAAKGKEWRAKLAQHVADNDLKAQPFRTNTRAAR